ncbi:hypothetical protein K440DRAFT_227092 [Wilcoxina mikolae CBS 423.85]|nr:hypothetical protein K440DRAFT_227092 [Wilcoxina mikolae CBS 423.85]
MCLWKNDYYSKCGHQPIYIQNICLNRTVARDVFDNQRMVRACNSINIPTVQTINNICPDCVLVDIPRERPLHPARQASCHDSPALSRRTSFSERQAFHRPDSCTEGSTLSRLSSYAESVTNRHISCAEIPRNSRQHSYAGGKPISNLSANSSLLSYSSSHRELPRCGYPPLYTESGRSISNTHGRNQVLSRQHSSGGIPILNRQASYTDIETHSPVASSGTGSPITVRYANIHNGGFFSRISEGRVVIPTGTNIGFESEVVSNASNKIARSFDNCRDKSLAYEESKEAFFARVGRQSFPDANFVPRSPKRRYLSRLEREDSVDVRMAMAAAIDGASPKKLTVDRRDGKRGFVRT